MIKYFRELLSTLKKIETHLSLISKCVNQSSRSYGDRCSISIKHWND